MQVEKDESPPKDILTRKKLFAIIALSVFLGIGIGYLMNQNSSPAPIVIEQVVSD